MVKVLFYVRVLRNHNIVIFVFLSFFFFYIVIYIA